MANKLIDELREQHEKARQQLEEAKAAEADLAAQIKAEERRVREEAYIRAGEAFEAECKKLDLDISLTKANMRKLAAFAAEKGFAEYAKGGKATTKKAAKKPQKSTAKRPRKAKQPPEEKTDPMEAGMDPIENQEEVVQEVPEVGAETAMQDAPLEAVTSQTQTEPATTEPQRESQAAPEQQSAPQETVKHRPSKSEKYQAMKRELAARKEAERNAGGAL